MLFQPLDGFIIPRFCWIGETLAMNWWFCPLHLVARCEWPDAL